MPSSGMLLRVALVRTDVSEERGAFIIKVIRIGELGTTLAVRSSETSVLTRATRRHSSSVSMFKVRVVATCSSEGRFPPTILCGGNPVLYVMCKYLQQEPGTCVGTCP
jgi:hypothetical protein